MLYDLVKLLHVLTVVLMAAPFYNLIAVHERVKFGKAHFQVDRYFENLVKGNAIRCFVFQATVLVTGLLAIILGGYPLTIVFTNGILLLKFLLFCVLAGTLAVVHFKIQPRVEELLSKVHSDTIPSDIAEKIAPLRAKRKKLAGFCLFILITIIILGMQVYIRYNAGMTLALVAAAGLFSWRVYKKPIPYGWF